MEKLDMKTPNFTDENVLKIAEIFPNCVTESIDDKGNLTRAIDFDLLRQELSANIVDGQRERYQINWPGKREALIKANEPINKTLRPYREESVNFDTTQNLYIEGDNLEALKLLQESYLGKVKMIYIDPPYNTGKDFIYKDNFTMESDEYNLFAGNVDNEGGKLVANPDSNGRFHSDWLSMLYPRLKLARNLLQDDGVIFISIDDSEQANLKRLCDDIFGEDNFVAVIIWRKKYGIQNDAKYFSVSHEYIVCIAKNKSLFSPNLLERGEEQNNRYKNPDNDVRGVWKAADFSVGRVTEKDIYPITTPSGRVILPPEGRSWVTSEDKFKELVNDNRIWFGESGNNVPSVKKFLTEVKQGITPSTFWDYNEVGHTDGSNKALKSLFDSKQFFDYPKPLDLLKRIISLGVNKSDLILDFFSGSGTTAHAVMQLNAEDGGNRKFVLVQLPEEIDEKSEAYKAGYKTIPEIGKERIRRAGKKILEENKDKEGIENLDIGFRVLKVDSSNMKDVYYTPDELSKESLFEDVENIKEDRKPEDLLFQVLLDWGVDLMLPIVREEILGKTVFFVDGDTLAACFDDGIDEEFVKELAKREMMRVVFKDSGFKEDDTKSNVEQIFTQLSPDTEVRAI